MNFRFGTFFSLLKLIYLQIKVSILLLNEPDIKCTFDFTVDTYRLSKILKQLEALPM